MNIVNDSGVILQQKLRQRGVKGWHGEGRNLNLNP